MEKKKLKLNDLTVKSFLPALDNKDKKTIDGGNIVIDTAQFTLDLIDSMAHGAGVTCVLQIVLGEMTETVCGKKFTQVATEPFLFTQDCDTRNPSGGTHQTIMRDCFTLGGPAC